MSECNPHLQRKPVETYAELEAASRSFLHGFGPCGVLCQMPPFPPGSNLLRSVCPPNSADLHALSCARGKILAKRLNVRSSFGPPCRAGLDAPLCSHGKALPQSLDPRRSTRAPDLPGLPAVCCGLRHALPQAGHFFRDLRRVTHLLKFRDGVFAHRSEFVTNLPYPTSRRAAKLSQTWRVVQSHPGTGKIVRNSFCESSKARKGCGDLRTALAKLLFNFGPMQKPSRRRFVRRARSRTGRLGQPWIGILVLFGCRG